MDSSLNTTEPLLAAPFWRHLLAMLYDSLLIIPLFMAAAALWIAFFGPTKTLDEPAVPAVLQWCSWILILLLFFGIFWRRAGQTLGMQAWRIELISTSGEPLTWKQVTIRLSGAMLSAVFFGGGYLWRFVPPHHRYWHDRLSQTRLVLVPKSG
ncbi:MAG: RDD family protein [Halieaceae bacterium]|nr:MAG: RDD family protein [Halieaceae bacterium]